MLAALPARAELSDADWRQPVRHLPLDWREEVRPGGLLALGLFGAAALVARPSDTTLRDDVLAQHPMGHGLAEGLSWAGNGLVLPPATLAVYGAGLWADSPAAVRFGAWSLEAQAASAVEVQLLKVSVRRRRPDGSDRQSFPSGHSAEAFSVATVAAEQGGWSAGVPAYLAAGLVAFSRIALNKHYLSDVVFGAGLGTAAGLAVGRAHAGGAGAALLPLALPGGAGVAALVRY